MQSSSTQCHHESFSCTSSTAVHRNGDLGIKHSMGAKPNDIGCLCNYSIDSLRQSQKTMASDSKRQRRTHQLDPPSDEEIGRNVNGKRFQRHSNLLEMNNKCSN
ncbi:hypothetical protein TNCV_3898861 [Trichonephila clavipes]|nr:hypothetical protein TNCV_3898861 [Trichonephila clavipes]